MLRSTDLHRRDRQSYCTDWTHNFQQDSQYYMLHTHTHTHTHNKFTYFRSFNSYVWFFKWTNTSIQISLLLTFRRKKIHFTDIILLSSYPTGSSGQKEQKPSNVLGALESNSYSRIHRLRRRTQLYSQLLNIRVTAASTERIFSSIKRIKTCLIITVDNVVALIGGTR